MLTQHQSPRLWIAGLVCLLATSASAQERTADYGQRDQSQYNAARPVAFWNGGGMCQQNNYYNAYNGYGPNQNVYPNYRDPSRGYVAYSHTGGSCNGVGWGSRLDCWKRDCANNCAAGRANFGHRFRCSMAWLRPLTYWDAGAQMDIIALDPNYANPNDLNQGYAAQGYGGPVSVPQAPNVRSNYNYGWGIPSSRLTPTSFPANY